MVEEPSCMTSTTVSVIICTYTYKRLERMLEAIDAVRGQPSPPQELVVCVDHNPELFADLRQRLGSEAVVVENVGARGLSDARNSAIAVAQGEIMVFLDDDAVPEQGWLGALLEPFVEPAVMGVGGSILPYWEVECPAWFAEELGWVFGCDYAGMQRNGAIRNPIGCNMAIRRAPFDIGVLFPSTIRRVGGNAAAGGETEFFFRVATAFPSARFVFAPMARVHHSVPADRCTVRYVLRRSLQEGIAKARIATLHRGDGTSTLSSEQRYVRYLVWNALPAHLLAASRDLRELARLAIICSVTAIAGGAYLFTRARSLRPTPQELPWIG